ncbi:MAG: PIN domain-containing protein [Chitinophagales bacterium]|nr:PIN domain-containing protein [Chitinophagales bacterium]
MEKLLVDTNIVIDLLSKREAFFEEAQELFTMADNNEVELLVSALTFANTHYLLAKHQKLDEARNTLIKFKVLVHVAALDNKIIELALVSDFKDFEDSIQYHTALENDVDIIITRNKKDFKNAKLPIMTAKEYLINR